MIIWALTSDAMRGVGDGLGNNHWVGSQKSRIFLHWLCNFEQVIYPLKASDSYLYSEALATVWT